MPVKKLKIGGASATAVEIQDARVPALAGNGGKVLAVNSGATGLEWVSQSVGGAGTLNTTATTAQATSSSESLGGSVTLHKVSKTGSYNDLLNQPTIPTVPTISTNVVTDKASDTKTSSPKSVYNEIHPATGSSQPSGGMLPNVFYNLGTLSANTTISFAAVTDSSIENEYMFQFAMGSTAFTITWPAAITKWDDDTVPTISANKTYQVSVINGLACFGEF